MKVHLPMLYKMFIVFLISIGFGESCSVGKHKRTPFQGSFLTHFQTSKEICLSILHEILRDSGKWLISAETTKTDFIHKLKFPVYEKMIQPN